MRQFARVLLTRHGLIAIVVLALGALTPRPAAAAGTITSLTVSPSPATVGSPVTITITGTGTCGNIVLDYGDRTPPATLSGNFPIQQQHTYQLPATTIGLSATAAADCSGQASALLTVNTPGAITGLTVDPSPATVGGPVTITVTGWGGVVPSCKLTLDYGDGTPPATLYGGFPIKQSHTYQQAATVTLTATAAADCSGQASARLPVAAPGTITGLTVDPSPATVGDEVTITVTGGGGVVPSCKLTLDYGDGTPPATLSGVFPIQQRHTYWRAKSVTLTAKPGTGCSGQASERLMVKNPGKGSDTPTTGQFGRPVKNPPMSKGRMQ